MKRKNRAVSRLMALLLAVAVVASMSVSAFAEGGGTKYTPTNGYVLQLGEGDSYWDELSAYEPTVDYGNGTLQGVVYCITFCMENGSETLKNLYCVDLPVSPTDNAVYHRVNLEDSTYAAALADQLRGILLNSYPEKTVDELAEASGIDGLTKDEAITGTQLAVWQTVHGDAFKVIKFGDENLVSLGSEKSRIERLFNYLLTLKGLKGYEVISEASFREHSTAPEVKENGDGTCNVTVTAKVFANVAAGDDLTLTAHLKDGAYSASTALVDGTKDYTLTIKNVPADVANGTVTLAIDGTQYAPEGVYLVDSSGIRGVSQSMVGVLEGTLPVHAEVKAEPDRVLKIYKTEKTENGDGTTTRVPLANISFDVYFVCSIEDYLSGNVKLSKVPTAEEIERYTDDMKYTNLVGTMTTDKDGRASLNLSTEDGIYLVKELKNEAVTSPCNPFYVMLPNWAEKDAETDTYPSYTVTAEPKNTTVSEGPDIEKSVTTIGQTSDTFDVGKDHTWIIRTGIPKTIAIGQEYVITDTLDYRLTYRKVEKVALAPKDGNMGETDLVPNTDYTVNVTEGTDNDGHSVKTVTIALTQTGMKKIGQLTSGQTGAYELRTYLVSQINQNAAVDAEIPNDAAIDYTNNVGKKFHEDSNEAEVHTGGIQLLKVNSDDQALAGATFTLYRMATQEEVAANELPTLTIGETTYKVVQCFFYATADLSGSAVTSLTTSTDGKGYLYGLAYGTYYLVETKAPDGYNLLTAPVEITIGEGSSAEDQAVKVTNTTGLELPTTGGSGTGAYTALGVLLMGAAAVLLLFRRRRAC